MMIRILVALAMASLLTLGCSHEPKSLARVSLDKDTLFVPAMLHVRLDDGHSVWTFGSDQIGEDPRYPGQWWTPEVETAHSGTLTMRFSFVTSEQDTVSVGRVSMPIRKDWRWYIGIYGAAGRSYYRNCFGCYGAEPFAILVPTYALTGSDSVWVIWGGNSISHPVIY
jgi:hypothetical protein